MTDFTLWLGFVGAFLGVAAYAPQILEMIRDRKAEGVSLAAWAIWLVSAIIIMPHAVETGDSLFIALQALTILSCGIVLFLALKYRKKSV